MGSKYNKSSFFTLLSWAYLGLFLRRNLTSTDHIYYLCLQICTDTYKRFMYSGLRDKAAVVRATLVQSIEAFVTKNNDVEVFIFILPCRCSWVYSLVTSYCIVKGESMNSTSKYVYSLTSNDQVSTTDASDPKLQILGLLKCLIDALLPENITPRNRLSVPIYLEAIAIIISLLPLTIINQRMFLNIIWQENFKHGPSVSQSIKHSAVFQAAFVSNGNVVFGKPEKGTQIDIDPGFTFNDEPWC